jgi:methylmalonyl-CoA mutase N-terminal domain/subunit
MSFDKKKVEEIKRAREAWESSCLKGELDARGERKKDFVTSSAGLTVDRLYTPGQLDSRGWDYNERLGFPGQYPFTRGVTPNMYRSNLFMTRQYGGFGTGKTTNERYKYMIEQGVREISVAMDLPTQLGYDSDNPLCSGEVGKVGVTISSLLDVEEIFDGIPLQDISVATTANSIGPIFLAWMLALAEKKGIPKEDLNLNLQNDVMKEYIARGTYIFRIRPSLKFSCDAVEYCIKNGLKNIMPINYCEYHIQEAGGDVVQGIAFCLANGLAYMDELLQRGIGVNDFPNPWVNITAGVDFFEEICKFRAMRRLWAKTMKERYQAANPAVMGLSFRCGAEGTRYTAQQPLNNIARGAISALVQALGGAQAVGIHSYDEALGIPTPESVMVAIRTTQIVAHESGVADTIDPLGGSYFVESLTDEIEDKSKRLLDRVIEMGGAVEAIDSGFMSSELGRSAYKRLREMETGERIAVGVNIYKTNEPIGISVFKVNPDLENRQIEKLDKLKKERDGQRAASCLRSIEEAAAEGVNLTPSILDAVKAYATVGEICGALRKVFKEYVPAKY